MPAPKPEPLWCAGLPDGWTVAHRPLSEGYAGWFDLRRPDGTADCGVGLYTNNGLGIEHEWITQPYCCNDGVETMEFVERDQLRARVAMLSLVLEMYP